MGERAQGGETGAQLVVGIGASAGGLEATKTLLEHMPRQSGMALVVVMHIDPHRESRIAQVLATATAMPVVQAIDDQTLEPDHVYVIAPDRVLGVHAGTLHSVGPRGAQDRKLVDTFLSSLAEDHQERAVGVILSGMGANGSEGLRDIKAHGGLCIAQAPATAKFDSMPKTAIATGVVDHVLAPEHIPDALVEYADRLRASKLRDADREIENARVFAEAIGATTRTAMLVLTPDLRILTANQAFCDAFRAPGSPPVEGELLYRLDDGAWDIPALRTLLDDALRQSGEVSGYEIDHEFRAIGRRHLTLNARLVQHRRLDLVLLAIEDETGRREAARVLAGRAEEIAQDHKRKDEFLAMLGHELRNPLAALMHGVDLLGLTSDAETAERVRRQMMHAAERMTAMLDQLLDIARLTSGKISMMRTPMKVGDLVRAGAEAAATVIEDRGHDLRVSLPEDGEDIVVLGDYARLIQVLDNLLTNAAKYTAPGGAIELAVEADADHVRIRVRDDGMGIPADVLPHIFEPFTQAPRSLERAAGGLGLGLPLVKRVVESHGGTVEASSPGPGEGSELVVTLPRMKERRARPRRDRDDEPAEEEAPRRVLVVDDEEVNATALAQLLNARGHETRVAHDGPSALEAAGAFQPDAVLLDLGLPGLDGYAVAKRLRKHNDRARFTLIALTGYQADQSRLEDAGFDYHLLKPPDMRKLYRLLGQPRLGRRA